MQCKAAVGLAFMVLAMPGVAMAQSQSPFMTGATSLETNILAWMTPIAIMLVMVLGAMAIDRPALFGPGLMTVYAAL